MQYALSGQPLSQAFRAQLEGMFGAQPEYLLVSELRRLGMVALLRRLASLRGERLVIAMENPRATAVLPALYCFAALTSVRQIELVAPDLQRQRVSRWQTVCSLSDALAASALAFNAVWRARRELPHLLGLPRIELPAPQAGRVLYAKTNMSFNVTAGGSVGHVAGVCGALQEHGYPLDFLAVEEPVLPRGKVNFYRVPPPRAYGLPYEANLYRYQHSFVKEALRFAADRTHSFIYQRLSLGNYAGPILSRRLKLPLVVEYNGSEAWVQKNWQGSQRYLKLAEMAERATLQHAHVIVTVSDVLRDELIERGIEPRRIVSYPNCIDPTLYTPERYSATQLAELRARWNIAADAKVACFVGTFGQWHGVEVLARTIARLHREHAAWCRGQQLHFLLVGDGVGMPTVRQELSSLDPGCYTLTGMVPQAEAPAYMAAADLLLSPHVPNPDGSRFFGSPTKLFEYMAMGKPIIASDLGQIGEVLRESVHARPPVSQRSSHQPLAILVQPGSEHDLAEAIRLLVDRPELAAQLGTNARAEALAKYTWQHNVGAVLQRLAEV